MVRTAVATGVGVLGVCFGGQLVAHALGGTVVRSPDPEIGWCEVRSSDPSLVPDGPWFQWHFDRFTLPPGAIEVARNDCATQAFVKGTAMGLQFHPEVDADLQERWITEDPDGDIARLGLLPGDVRASSAAELDDAADIVTSEIDEHHVLSDFFGMFAKLSTKATIFFFGCSAATSARDGTRDHAVVDKLHHRLWR